jgi:hypothetical protein
MEVDATPLWRASLEARGITFGEQERVPAQTMKATQTELVGEKVGGMMANKGFDPSVKPIYISSDGYILDGHHRWATVVGRDHIDGMDPPLTMNVIKVNLPIEQLLSVTNEFLDGFGIGGNAANADNTGAPVPAGAAVAALGMMIPAARMTRKGKLVFNPQRNKSKY